MLLKNWLYKSKLILQKAPTINSGSFLYALFFILNSLSITAQINLVQNPSFELYTICPNSQSQITFCNGWDTLINGGGGTPDFYNACDNSNSFSVPYNIFSFQYAHSGVGYSQIVLYYNLQYDGREYIQSRLIKKLVSNKNYCITAYVNLNNFSTCGIDKIGIYFDNGTIHSPVGKVAIGINPQIVSPTGVFLTDTLNWVKIQGLFMASGAEEYITIGNFSNDILTSTTPLLNNPAQSATYYIDDVSVIDVSTAAYAGRDTLICAGDSVFIGRYNEIGLDCEWYNNNQLLANGSGLWVKPVTNQQYIVKQDICGYVSYDTINITIKPENCYDLENIDIPNVFTPNADGVNDTWHVTLKNATNVSYAIYNRWGNIIKESELTHKRMCNGMAEQRQVRLATMVFIFTPFTIQTLKVKVKKRRGTLV